MGYWITKFGSTVLSTKAPLQEQGISAALDLQELPGGGVHDPWGADRASVRLPYPLPCTGTITAANAAAMHTAIAALRALIGQRDWLYRTPDGGADYRDKVLARLEDVRGPRKVENGLVLPVTLAFAVENWPWQGADGTVNDTLDGGGGVTTIVCANDGNARVTSIVITITALVAPITSITVAVAGISTWTWTGTLAVGKALVANCGIRTIRNDGANAYGGFTFNAGNTVADWLRLEPGNNSVVVTMVGGDATSTISIAYADGWA